MSLQGIRKPFGLRNKYRANYRDKALQIGGIKQIYIGYQTFIMYHCVNDFLAKRRKILCIEVKILMNTNSDVLKSDGSTCCYLSPASNRYY